MTCSRCPGPPQARPALPTGPAFGLGSLSPWGVTWAPTQPPGVQSAASRGCLQPPQARHSHAELSAFSSPPARRTVPESNVAVCLHAFPLPAPRPVRQRGLPLHPYRPQARLPSPPLSGLPDAQWPVQRRREPLRVPPDLPPHSLTLCHMPASLCSTRRPSLRFQTVRLPCRPRVLPPQPSDPVHLVAETFSQPPSPEASRPSVPRDTRGFPSKQ